jgi:hypothetical protein
MSMCLQVSIEPPVTNKKIGRDVMKKLRETFGEEECGGKRGAYDGEKSLSISTPKNSQCFLMTRKAPLTGESTST